MKFKYKLKRFLYSLSKLLLRILFFSCFILTLCFNSFALAPGYNSYDYENFRTFLGDSGLALVYVNSSQSVNDFVLTTSSQNDIIQVSRLDGEGNRLWFRSFYVECVDSSNIKQLVNKGDILYFKSKFVVDVQGSVSSHYSTAFSFRINYLDTNDNYKSALLYSTETVESSSLEDYTVDGVSYKRVTYNLNFKYTLPTDAASIDSITFSCDEITSRSASARLLPSNDSALIYYIGDEASAPIYDVSDGSSINEYHESEDELYNLVDGSSTVNSLVGDVKGFIDDDLSIFKGLRASSSIFNGLIQNDPFDILLKVSLIIGSIAFLLSIANNYLKR